MIITKITVARKRKSDNHMQFEKILNMVIFMSGTLKVSFGDYFL